ncbi:hypothetical protein [Pedobacter puniceum]|uniref:Phosphatidate cytidylyltransferase n=2 Tax=Pedobacter TaxID=84567 RepID=A0A7K0FNV6_9SPHI|nr:MULTISPECIES: hypothetical protein [Pedobacter]MRX47613.1 phosphatidate cytidylyltransferase [Pedobacter puniceum]QEK52522.1 phosphatidate cytidylyltransferase [Pedobacter aquae]
MKKLSIPSLLLLLTLLSSCEAIGTIFKAGYYVGIFVVVIILVIIFFIYNKFRR